MARRVEYGLAVGDEQSHGRSFPSEPQAVHEGQAVADGKQVDVSLLCFEVDAVSGEIVQIELLRVLHPKR